MIAIRTLSTNRIYGPPKESDRDCIGDLPVTVDAENGILYSFWQPSEVDIANILAGQPVRLAILGMVQPPVVLEVTDKA